jgi:probable rRNA maturation factor
MRRAAEATLQHQNVPEACELAVLVTGDETLRELNRRHRGVDEPTDVLAFPNEARGPFVDAPGLPRYLGDVIISFPRAKAQAVGADNELSAELQLLVVHGVLHLLGYDDQTEPGRARMWRVQQAVLDSLGIEVHLPH